MAISTSRADSEGLEQINRSEGLLAARQSKLGLTEGVMLTELAPIEGVVAANGSAEMSLRAAILD